MIDTKIFYTSLCKHEIDFFAGVPDSLLSDFCAYMQENCSPKKYITTANEGNAVGMALGYHLSTGKYGLVYMQNSGEGNAVNPLISLADPDVVGIPMLLLIGWRGEPGKKDEPQHVKQGIITCTLLDTLGIPYEVLDEGCYEEQLDQCVGIMREQSRPVALIVRKGSFLQYKLPTVACQYAMTREQALSCILTELRPDEFVVSTTGKTSREVFELREKRCEGHANDFLTVGGMGHTSSIAFGMAAGMSNNVYCLDGDGSFIMHMGALAVIGQHPCENLFYILLNNGAHESVGGQPTIGFSVKAEDILKDFGFKQVYRAETEAEIRNVITCCRGEVGCALVVYIRQGSRTDLGRPTCTPQQNKRALMDRIQETNTK